MLNSPINDYSLDSSSNEVSGDPHAAMYISNRVDLQQPATSLKVIVGALDTPVLILEFFINYSRQTQRS